MRRTLLRFFPALSLLLCVVVCGLWARSYFRPVVQRFEYRGESCEAALTNGRIRVSNAPAVVAQAIKRKDARAAGATTMPASTVPLRMWTSLAAGPLLVVVGLAIPPTLAAKRSWDARRNRSRGLCPACGYDLRATPDRCPECGVAGKAVPA